jgi:plastocyanin
VKRRHSISSLAVVAAIALTLASCGGSNDSGGSSNGSKSTSSSQPASGGSSGGVTISNFKFAPSTDSVKQGAAVSVTNNDSTAHTATSDDGKSFDTGDINPGSSAKVTVAKPGSYPYHCSIHPFMHGTLKVQ